MGHVWIKGLNQMTANVSELPEANLVWRIAVQEGNGEMEATDTLPLK